MVFIISKSGNPLMPTERHGKVRRMLKDGRAKVIQRKPFTIQLLYDSKEYIQNITLGIDSGYNHIGYSAISNDKELVGGEIELLKGQSQRLKDKVMHRRNRRARLRHRKPRFGNRKRPNGWLAPSIQHKVDTHKKFIKNIKSILPISKIVIEVGEFDIQKLKNPDISGKEYQEGEKYSHYNTRQYVLHRDNYTCQVCGDEDTIFQVHHIGFWKGDMSNRPANLMTVCIKCHITRNHEQSGKLWGLSPKDSGFKEATFMTLIRSRLVGRLRCDTTYGYITKYNRLTLELPKSHHNDAFVIAGGTTQTRVEATNYKEVRRNNRSLDKFYDAKYLDTRTKTIMAGKELDSGRRKRNKNHKNNTENLRQYRGHKISKGRRSIRTKRYFYQPNDLVKFEGGIHVVVGSQNKGAYVKLKDIKKVPKTDKLEPYKFQSGLVVV